MPKIFRPKKARRITFWRIGALLAMALVVISSTAVVVSQGSSAASSQYQAVARRSLKKLCTNYDCPQGYVESALPRIVFVDRSEYEWESRKDALSSDQNGEQSLAFTTKAEPRTIFVNIENVKDLSREGIPLDDALEEILDHEVIHQAAISQTLPAPLTITFNNKSFVAIATSGLSLMNAEGRLENNRSNEAYTQWLALSQMRTHKVRYNVQLYDTGPQIVEVLNSRVGLERRTAFNLYVNEGLPGFTAYFAKAAGQALIQKYGSHTGLAVFIYLDRVLAEINQGQYSVSEALRRLNEFNTTGDAPPQK